MQRVGIADRSVKAERSRPKGVELCRRAGVSACKQRYIVTERNQFLNEPINNPLRSAIELGRNGFGQRGNLGNQHGMDLLTLSANSPQAPTIGAMNVKMKHKSFVRQGNNFLREREPIVSEPFWC